MISIQLTGSRQVARRMAQHGRRAHRAMAEALNRTAYQIMRAEQKEMRRIFDKPTPYSIKSLEYDQATADDLRASVWFNRPLRMRKHYLEPQVIGHGGPRSLKGFERAIGMGELVPSRFVKRDRYGNVSMGVIRQLLSVLGKAESGAGYSANITARSRRRNTKERDYVVIKRGHGRLRPGVYKRTVQAGREFTAQERRIFTAKSRAYQRGLVRGNFSRVTRARGLMPVLLKGRTGAAVRSRLDFYGVAKRTANRVLVRTFNATLDRYLRMP